MNLELLKVYDAKQNYISVGGFRLGGFGEDAVVEYELGADIFEHNVGADSLVTFSRTNDLRLIAAVTVMETSPSYRRLGLIINQQLAQLAVGALLPLPYLHADALNGDLIRSAQAVMISYPSPNKARTVSERTFQIALPYAADKMQLGALNLGA